MAYTDLLTGGLNRTAFYRDVDSLISQYDQITVIQFDLNRLKYINDNFGHAVGDEALSNAYRCIKAAFGSFGSCYRTGGDEFICLLHHINTEELDARIVTFEQLVAQTGSGKPYPFGVALGTALYEKGKGSFKQCMISADQQMYKDKRKKEASLDLAGKTE